MLRIYGYGSVLVVLVGFGLISVTEDDGGKAGAVDELWIWLSLVLWVVAVGLVLGVVVPTLDKASARIEKEESVVSLTGRVAAVGGLVGVLFVAVVVLMVYRPGH